jgi:hypothetical protein
MKERWNSWRCSQQAKLLFAAILMLLTVVVMPFIARFFAGENGLVFLRFTLDKNSDLSMTMSPWIIGVLLVWLLIGYLVLWPRNSTWEACEVNIEVAKVGKVVMKPNQEVAGIAHRAWTEIVTRKAGIPFDEDHDVILEIYDSWYQLFGEIRSMIKGIPVDKLKTDPNARKLVDILLVLLNDVLRPHLTHHQARYRFWLTKHEDRFENLSPQDIQKAYPQYKSLIESLQETNAICVDISRLLKVISLGKE